VTGVLARKARAALDVVVATAAVRRARRLLAQRPVGTLVGKSDATVPPGDSGALTADERQCADRWGAAVDRALRWTPGDSACLVRAGALLDLVARRGLPRASVRIGVRRGAAGFEAHAWVEQDGIPIAEPAALRGTFSSLEGVTLR
jgi:hypothetical protein